MKLLRFYHNDEIHTGVLTDRGVADLTALGFPGTVNDVIAGGRDALDAIETLLAGDYTPLPYETLRFANVVDDPSKIVCVGLNYNSHALETGGTAPKEPVLFSKFSDTLTPAGEPVALPPWQRCYDYEAELVIVMGKPCYHVTAAEAMDYVFGYTVGNDLSARDCQFLSNQWLSGKSFPGFSPAGPVIVTADSFDPDAPHAIRCIWNGNLVQNGSTDDMIFNCARIVESASRFFALKPGDLIYTGTPAGVILGKAKGTRVWMKPGDHVRVEIEGICALDTPLV
ncbi:MAG: fumarylacetoacetate hydrolase family protein [Oscillospiraceae bacterium]|jgi:2-keto-4-pentenoate hydratase/2-oxohepta-3-ene-1,7-dioic acid hydratase in catechol pathway|nr:fumarylacetoacetate hydrolase family protein [Oscillospiraceae bacterium]